MRSTRAMLGMFFMLMIGLLTLAPAASAEMVNDDGAQMTAFADFDSADNFSAPDAASEEVPIYAERVNMVNDDYFKLNDSPAAAPQVNMTSPNVLSSAESPGVDSRRSSTTPSAHPLLTGRVHLREPSNGIGLLLT